MNERLKSIALWGVIGLLYLCLSIEEAHAQCPLNQADLENGGTFSGDCDITATSDVTIGALVDWTSGRMTILGGYNLIINSSYFVQNGATIDVDNGGLTVSSSGTLLVNSGGAVEINGSTSDLTVDGGTLTSAGNITVSDDFFVQNGGDFDLSAGTLDVTRDMYISGSGTTFDLTGSAQINDTDDINIANSAVALFGTGTVVNLIDNLVIDNASLTIEGTVENTDAGTGANDIILNGTANVTINAGADIKEIRDVTFGSGDGNATLTMNGGSLSLTDDFDFNNSTDNDNVVLNGGMLDIGGDLAVGTTNGSMSINTGSTVTVATVDGGTPTDEASLPSQINLNGGVFEVDGVSLPVVLLSFDAYYDPARNVVSMVWSTASELNNEGFHVQKSSDGHGYESIGFVKGNGTVNELCRYEFIDDQVSMGVHYYQLMQIDHDGTETIIVKTSIATQFGHGVTLYPNPVTEPVTLTALPNGVRQISIFTLNGMEVLSYSSSNVAQTEQVLNEFFQAIESGTYLIKVLTPHGQWVDRVIKP